MYGMVNKAIEHMIMTQHGEVAWSAVKRRAGVTEDVFIATREYPDALTHALVTAAGECTGISTRNVWLRLGEHWILHVAAVDYAHLLDAAGKSAAEFLASLPQFHDRLSLLFPNLNPPRFRITDRDRSSLRLHYTSDRPGLTALVEGMLAGIGRRLNQPLQVTRESSCGPDGNTTAFLISWGC